MCGIVGYCGTEPAISILLEGLERLEYRGYDSAGVALMQNGELSVFRQVGKVEELVESVRSLDILATSGIGHTRWATHGPPTEDNAHPQQDCSGDIVVVHNGIIENYGSLREELADSGHNFRSQTDTEVLAHLIEQHYSGDLLEAVREALKQVKGAFAIAVLAKQCPGQIVVAKRASPLVVGTGGSGTFVASDMPALAGRANKVFFLNDDEIARLTASSVQLYSLSGEEITRTPNQVTIDPISIQKSGFKHFMLKEIHEQSRAVGETVREKVGPQAESINLPSLERIKPDFDRVYFVACGTAYHAGLTAEYLWEQNLPVPIQAVIASEFRYRNVALNEKSLVVAVSQSGETIDTLMAVRKAKEKGAQVIGVVNSVGSAIQRESDATLYTRAGTEIGVAATKTFTCQLAALALLGLFLAQKLRLIDPRTFGQTIAALNRLPSHIASVVAREQEIVSLANRFYTANDFLFLARDCLYPIALEGALKLKEISYIHAEGYPAGEMKHGPIALIEENLPVVMLLTQQSAYDKVMGNVEEVKARKGTVIAFTDLPSDPAINRLADYVFSIPEVSYFELPVIYSLPLQLLAYHIAVLRGTDVDQPRNLAKTVTVE